MFAHAFHDRKERQREVEREKEREGDKRERQGESMERGKRSGLKQCPLYCPIFTHAHHLSLSPSPLVVGYHGSAIFHLVTDF